MIKQIFAGLLLAEAVVFGVLAFAAFRKKQSKIATCYRTWGDVVEVKEHNGSEGPTRHPVIRYRAEAGDAVTFESRFGSSGWDIKTGDRLEILISRSNPADAEVVGFMAQWGMPLILAVVAFGSLMLAPVIYLFM